MEASGLSGSYRPGHRGSRTEPGYRPSANSRDAIGRSDGWLPMRRSLGSGTDEGLAMTVGSRAATSPVFELGWSFFDAKFSVPPPRLHTVSRIDLIEAAR